jgi:hypothetical protein
MKMVNYDSLMAKAKDLHNDLNQAGMSAKLPPNYRSLQNSISDFLHGSREFKTVTQDDNTGAGGAFSFDAFNRFGVKSPAEPTFVRANAVGKFGSSPDLGTGMTRDDYGSLSSDEPKKQNSDDLQNQEKPKKVMKNKVSPVSPQEEIDQADPADIYANVASRANNRIQGEVYGPSGTGQDGDFSKFANPQAAKEYFMQNFSGQAADHLHFAKFLRAFKHKDRNMQESFMKTLTKYNGSRWTS